MEEGGALAGTVVKLIAPPGGLLILELGYGRSVESLVSSATVYLPLEPLWVLLGSNPGG